MTRYTVELPKAAIAGLVGERAESLEEIQDTTPRVVPLSHTWSPSGDVFVGCKGGHILKVILQLWLPLYIKVQLFLCDIVNLHFTIFVS